MAQRRQSFLSGAMVLSGAVAITKVLGALYKIPLGNLLGSEGMAHFYAAYNVFNVLVMFCAGMPAAMSRMVSQSCALGKREAARRTFFTGSILLGLIGTAGTLAMSLFAPHLAELLHDPRAEEAIRALSPALLAMSLCGAVRGYTQGLGDMRSTAVSQILESIGKLAVGLGACYILLRRGFPVEKAVSGALWGVVAGGILAFSYLLLRLRRIRSGAVWCRIHKKDAGDLLHMAIPMTLSAAGMSILTLLDQALVLRTLQHALGYSTEQAAAAYGEYTFSMTLFVLAPSLIMPLSAALLPGISGALAGHQEKMASHYTWQALRLATFVGIPLGIGLSALAGPLLQMLYPAQPLAAQAAAWHLRLLGIAAVFVGLSAVSGGILQAYGKPRIPLIALAVGGSAKLLCNVVLVSQEDIAVRGVSIGTLVCYGLICIVQLWAVRKCSGNERARRPLFWSAGLSAVTMALAVTSLYGLLETRCSAFLACCCSAAAGGGVYLILMLSLGGITWQEMKKLLPHRGARRLYT